MSSTSLSANLRQNLFLSFSVDALLLLRPDGQQTLQVFRSPGDRRMRVAISSLCLLPRPSQGELLPVGAQAKTERTPMTVNTKIFQLVTTPISNKQTLSGSLAPQD